VPLVTDDGKAIIEVKTESGKWFESGNLVSIADEANPNDTNIRNLYSYIINNDGTTTRLRDVGYLNLNNGRLELFANTLFSDDSELKLTFIVIPKSNDIIGARNVLLDIDVESCNITGEQDQIAAGGTSRSVDYTTFNRDR